MELHYPGDVLVINNRGLDGRIERPNGTTTYVPLIDPGDLDEVLSYCITESTTLVVTEDEPDVSRYPHVTFVRVLKRATYAAHDEAAFVRKLAANWTLD